MFSNCDPLGRPLALRAMQEREGLQAAGRRARGPELMTRGQLCREQIARETSEKFREPGVPGDPQGSQGDAWWGPRV